MPLLGHPSHPIPQILVLGALGALAQATLSLIVALIQGSVERPHPIDGARNALANVTPTFSLTGTSHEWYASRRKC